MRNNKLFFQKRTLQETEQIMRAYLENPSVFRIATINTEYLLERRNNDVFKKALLNADYYVCDGIGVKWWYFLYSFQNIQRITGVDISEKFLEICDKRGSSVFVVLRKNGLSSLEEVRKMLKKKYKNISFFLQEVAKEERSEWKQVQKSIKERSPDGILCGLGIPEQEIFLERVQKMGIKAIMIGVGGTFDFWTGKQKRAPLWMRRAGLEWLWRFYFNPKRFFRFLSRFISR
ncbi:MAG: glycosyltransferase [Candidatus Moranbacteria bacterium]|nr:glycosyltransferase [Candidatus Moranbacteria bacterium]